MAETDVIAPMVGKIIAVHVKPGDSIKENDPLVTLEAMKMEMPVPAPQAGTIKEVYVSEGDVVESDTILVTIE
ncbi:MAG: acetyl-CoA carboxylase biotin carboxyl carrier protein subunit [Planctomycetota bacterium]|nr:MAG: acetyl-CoA carboxylase biotin carboxyl carrier protein subunit [Planctomycetota bacterium]